jgi:hypothetical protein
MAHASFSEHRRDLLPTITKTWGDHLHDVVVDEVGRGAWPTVRACWHRALELAGGQGHVLAAQDDFSLVPGAPELMGALSNRFPERILAFRWPKASCSWLWHLAVRDDTYWAKCNHAWTGGSVALPVALAEEFLVWADRFDAAGGDRYEHLDDVRLDLWALASGNPMWRLRWTLIHHEGDDYSIVRGGRRPPSPEMGVVASAAELPSLDDPKWNETEVPEYTDYPEGLRLSACAMLKGKPAELGL